MRNAKYCVFWPSIRENHNIFRYQQVRIRFNLLVRVSDSPDRNVSFLTAPNIRRDYEYKRHGTLSLLAGIDLISGKVHSLIRERHKSSDFIDFLKLIDAAYPAGAVIYMVLDNHTIHTSRETRAFLDTRKGRFQFVFTPKHASWLNLIEALFSKMARVSLRGLRVNSKEELRAHIERWVAECNEDPVPFRWRWKMVEVHELISSVI